MHVMLHRHPERRQQRGNALVEVALILPVLAMRSLTALDPTDAADDGVDAKSAVRNSIVHGEACVEMAQACQATVADVAGVVYQKGAGLDPARLRLVLSAGSRDVECATLSAVW